MFILKFGGIEPAKFDQVFLGQSSDYFQSQVQKILVCSKIVLQVSSDCILLDILELVWSTIEL